MLFTVYQVVYIDTFHHKILAETDPQVTDEKMEAQRLRLHQCLQPSWDRVQGGLCPPKPSP